MKSQRNRSFDASVSKDTGEEPVTPKKPFLMQNLPSLHEKPGNLTGRKGALMKLIRTNNIDSLVVSDDRYIYARENQNAKLLDERADLTATLRRLKKNFDESRLRVTKLEQDITRMRVAITKENEDIRDRESTMRAKNEELVENIKKLEEDMEMANRNNDESILVKEVYDHMLDVKKVRRSFASELNWVEEQENKISIEIKVNRLDALLAASEKYTEKMVKRQRQTKQKDVEGKVILDKILENVESEQKKRDDQISLFKTTLKHRKGVERKRDERMRRQHEVAMFAAKTSKDTNETRWRQLLVAQKVFTIFLRNKMEKEMMKFQIVEQAFQKIRSSTGLNDTYEIVYKFVNREGFYTNLVQKINQQKELNESIRSENNSLRGQIEATQAKIKEELTKIQEMPKEKPEVERIKRGISQLKVTFLDKMVTQSRVNDWLFKQHKKLSRFDSFSVDEHGFEDQYKEFNMKDSIAELVLKVKKYALTVDKVSMYKMLEETKGLDLKEEMFSESYNKKFSQLWDGNQSRLSFKSSKTGESSGAQSFDNRSNSEEPPRDESDLQATYDANEEFERQREAMRREILLFEAAEQERKRQEAENEQHLLGERNEDVSTSQHKKSLSTMLKAKMVFRERGRSSRERKEQGRESHRDKRPKSQSTTSKSEHKSSNKKERAFSRNK